jgi:general secretion pathway protein A
MYLEYYGLKEAPFNLTPDPKFLFFTHNHREAFDLVLYGISNRKGFVELTGEVGSGKTTICRAILASLTPGIQTSLILNPFLTENQLLRSILNDFGLKVKGRDRLSHIETLNSFLLANLQSGTNVALIIDEAQDLSPAVLEQVRLLSNLETDQHKLLQIVLCGQPELRQRLASPDLRQLRQRISVRYHLLPLNESETIQYIEYRLKMAGWHNGQLFVDSAVRRIHNYARGIPRLINSVCDIALLAGYVASAATIDVNCVNKAIKQLEGLSS